MQGTRTARDLRNRIYTRVNLLPCGLPMWGTDFLENLCWQSSPQRVVTS